MNNMEESLPRDTQINNAQHSKTMADAPSVGEELDESDAENNLNEGIEENEKGFERPITENKDGSETNNVFIENFDPALKNNENSSETLGESFHTDEAPSAEEVEPKSEILETSFGGQFCSSPVPTSKKSKKAPGKTGSAVKNKGNIFLRRNEPTSWMFHCNNTKRHQRLHFPEEIPMFADIPQGDTRRDCDFKERKRTWTDNPIGASEKFRKLSHEKTSSSKKYRESTSSYSPTESIGSTVKTEENNVWMPNELRPPAGIKSDSVKRHQKRHFQNKTTSNIFAELPLDCRDHSKRKSV